MFRRTLTLGHISAIPIRIHWSWLIVFSLLIATIAPVYIRYAPPPYAWMLAALVGLLISASILLHELGHALVAQRCAVKVQRITLFALGGAAEIQNESPSPGSEFAIAVAGPAVSLLLAIICGGACLGLGMIYTPMCQMLSMMAFHLALSNGMMAVFNLLPGYPMDGGRILRATLWFLADDMLAATRIAARVGQICGVGLGIMGVAIAVATVQPFIAIWMGLIGFFLYRTAARSYLLVLAHTALTGISVADLMQRSYRAVIPELTLEQFVAHYVLGQSEQGFPVVRNIQAGEQAVGNVHTPILIGMMTLRNLRRFRMSEWAGTHVGDAMTPMQAIYAISPAYNAADALSLMRDMHVDLLPVTDGPHLVGILRRRDLAVFIQMHIK